MNLWIRANEALWLFWVLFGELVVGLYSAVVLTIEYFYDVEIDKIRLKRTRRGSRVKVYKQGNTTVVEQPKGVDIQVGEEQ